MHDDFVIVGPVSDPAHIRGLTDAREAFQRIAASQSPFVSRGDDSGTEKKELAIWASAGVNPGGASTASWYARAGQGMGEVLKMSSEKQAYTLTDRPTFLFMQDQLQLHIAGEGDPMLLNPYTVIEVVGARNASGARAFSSWVTSPEGQKVIGSYGVSRFGKQLFVPDAAR
jgi:tungstate transport system substrate-binding protein